MYVDVLDERHGRWMARARFEAVRESATVFLFMNKQQAKYVQHHSNLDVLTKDRQRTR